MRAHYAPSKETLRAIDATGARSTSEWTCAELEPCGCGSNASAVLFVGVLGLGLKRRKAKG